MDPSFICTEQVYSSDEDEFRSTVENTAFGENLGGCSFFIVLFLQNKCQMKNITQVLFLFLSWSKAP